MALVDECIFCKIIRGEIPSFKVWEDDKTFAFMDINPVAKGHALIVPKFHTPNIYEAPQEWLGPTLGAVGRVARAVRDEVQPDGMNILQANDKGAAQSVFHIHFHVIPRIVDDGLTMNWDMVPGDMDEIDKLAEKIAAHTASE
ncbi:MAG: HIT family protein [Rhodospirillales bacterium]|nr:HIT family protein [Rhodospirillales bacterium]MBO6787270.1 HIT family protein [Rhodospirillales bacterium]